MYGGFDVFRTYLAVKLHFTSDYDYFEFDGKVNAKLDTFTKRNDRYFFHKLSKRYKESQILDFFVANFSSDHKKWAGSLLSNEGSENYAKFRKYKESIRYHFRNDCLSILNDFSSRRISFDDGFRVVGGQHPRILRLLIQGKINIQTAIIYDSILSFGKVWSKEINEKVIWPKIAHTIAKLKPFVKYNETECKLIMKEIFVNG